ncbi:MAG: hypothetical protein IJ190_13910 [Prevotella sp.]|nr:hypothetical protein [Prevotella sp.]
MDAIGGYFSLELPLYDEYHKGSIKLNTGRNCLEYILRARKYSKVYIPYYTCEAVLEPLRLIGIPYEYYHIDIYLEIIDKPILKDCEALLYTNYFGLKQRYVEKLAKTYGPRLIVDNTQAFYAKRIDGIDTFYSCRKFFGVPDGAYLFCDANLDLEIEQDISYERFSHLLKRIDLSPEQGYSDFREVEDSLTNQPIRRMSKLTERMMKSIDYCSVAKQRKNNFVFIHNTLGAINLLPLSVDEEAVPQVYPFMVSVKGLRQLLNKNKLFIACYWPNVLEWTNKDDFEYLLASNVLPLPIDQRYSKGVLENMLLIIRDYRL